MIGATAFPFFPHEREPIGVSVWKCAQQYRVNDTEDGSVCTDTQREREQRDERHARALEQHACSKANVLKHCVLHIFYSQRSASIGSTLVARKAGT